jgi:hypothetical protein
VSITIELNGLRKGEKMDCKICDYWSKRKEICIDDEEWVNEAGEDVCRYHQDAILKPSVSKSNFSDGLSSPFLHEIAKEAVSMKKELFKKNEWVLNHKITPGDVRIVLEAYDKYKAR